jgi:hypothetical protein
MWLFPHFTDRMVFDPTIDVVSDLAVDENSTDQSDMSAASDITTWLIVGALLLFFVGAGLYILKRKQTVS